jgi:hypothetical protein
MHRIEGQDYDSSTGVNLFAEGPPGTVVTQQWLNAVQEELIALILNSGQSIKTAATETRSQLLSGLFLGKYYYADASEADQNVTATGDLKTIKDCVDEIGSAIATIVLVNSGSTTTYTVASGALSIPDNISLHQQPGAILHFNTGITGAIAGPLTGSGLSQRFSMADRDSLSYTGPTMLVDKWFGSENDNSANDSNAINDMIGAAPAYGKVHITKGFLKVNSVEFDVDDLTIVCDGQFKPYSNTGYCVRIGTTSASNVMRVRGNINVDSASTYETYDTVIGLELVNLNGCQLTIRAEGFAVGVDVYGNSDGCAYNTFYLQDITNSKINMRLDARGTLGWCNQNIFVSGRFGWNSGLNYSGTKHIQIVYDASNIVNNNVFYGPSLENGDSNSIAIDCDGVSNLFLDCRLEMGGYHYQTMKFGANSSRNKFSTVYSDSLITEAISLPGSITGSNNVSITLDTDPQERVWPGTLLVATIGGEDYNVIAFESGTTVKYAHPLEADSGNLVTAIKAIPVWNEGRTNQFDFSRVDDPATANLSMISRHENIIYNEGGAAFQGTGSYIPALSLITGSSGADAVLAVMGFNYKRAMITGRGDYNTYNDSGQSTIDITADDNDCGQIVVKNAGSDVFTLDAFKGSITFAAVSSATATNNSLYRDSGSGKIRWKDNSGTSHDLY